MSQHRNLASAGLLLPLSMLWIASGALATPAVNSAVFHLRVFNDCPISILTTHDSYPTGIWMDDSLNCTSGFANLHNWRLSETNFSDAVFLNSDAFRFEADLVITGTGNGEAGLQISPWWSQNVDGKFNVRTTDGDIACAGGRLPSFSFTGTYGLHYTKGNVIHLKMTYLPHGLSMANPGTIRYEVVYLGNSYDSGQIPFTQGNPVEDPPYGLWGILNDARVGGHLMCPLSSSTGRIRATWSNIVFTNLSLLTGIEFTDPSAPPATRSTTWGNVKGLYR
jgi:hypothetical protein